ncbi:alpha/beta hydrolase [Streptomyces sp. ACA25]|nr:alpha/beta hydrolase [Streptomyces sp. ACA25]MDB1086030.1 alpha/beta hydrolase [Streptomyces sp. ACA25]
MTELTGRRHARPDRSVRYGAHPSQVIDVYGDGPPRVVVLHGGFWREAYDRRHLSPFAAALVERGLCVALPEYRRSGGGGGWPETFDDVTAALAALPGTEPVVLAGHSAGGHLALWAASRGSERIGRTVAVAPVADLTRADELGLGNDAVAEFLGARRPTLLPRLDPLLLPTPPAPVTLLHGTDDSQVPLELSMNYQERHGAQLLRLPGVGHYAPVTPGTSGFATLALVLERVS